MKMFALRHHYFAEPWNLFDFVVVLLSLVSIPILKKSFKIINAIQIKISINDFDHTHVSGGAVSK